jgi:hypothetical protein
MLSLACKHPKHNKNFIQHIPYNMCTPLTLVSGITMKCSAQQLMVEILGSQNSAAEINVLSLLHNPNAQC